MDQRHNRSALDHLLGLSPDEFEKAIADLLPLVGYTDAKRTGGAGDLGVDIVCYDEHGGLIVVQCKRYAPGNAVTSPNIQQFFGMMVHHGARQGIYVTTSTFTRGAVDLAAARDIRTIDGPELATLVAAHPGVLGSDLSVGDRMGAMHTPSRQKRWRLTELPTPNGLGSEATAVNNRAQVVGNLSWLDHDYRGRSRAVLWERGRMVDLKTAEGWDSCASDINDLGQVVGQESGRVARIVCTPYGGCSEYQEFTERAILWDRGRRIELDGLESVSAINNRGEIIGHRVIRDSPGPSSLRSVQSLLRDRNESVLWHEGRVIILEGVTALTINNYGVIVGTRDFKPVRWERGHLTPLALPAAADYTGPRYDIRDPDGSAIADRDLARYTGITGLPFDINDHGQIVGYVEFSYDFDAHPVERFDGRYRNFQRFLLWQNDELFDLSIPNAEGRLTINNVGQISGWRIRADVGERGCLWEDGQTIVLPVPTHEEVDGWRFEPSSETTAINDLGQIAGKYEASEGDWRACLWE